MKYSLTVWAVLVACAALCAAYPTQKQATSPGAFIGEGINDIAAAMLQDSEKQGNAAFSPLGHSAILAALAEGASGKTRAQLLSALKLPQDSSLTRATYRSVLSKIKEKNAVTKPEFRSWFYVYKKSTKVEEAYATLLRDHYLMEVRDVEDVEEDTPTEFFSKKEEVTTDTAKDEVSDTAPMAVKPVVEESVVTKDEVQIAVQDPSATVQAVQPELLADAKLGAVAPAHEEAKKDEPAKPVEVPVEKEGEPQPAPILHDVAEPTKDEQAPIQATPVETVIAAAESAEATSSMSDSPPPPPGPPAPVIAEEAKKEEDLKPTVMESEESIMKEKESGTPAETITTMTEEAKETMEEKIALAKFGKAGDVKDEKKPTSVPKGDKKKTEEKKKARLAAGEAGESNDRQPSSGPASLTSFNALYYKGDWQVPFDAKFRDDFFIGGGEKKEVTTMRAQGTFRYGEIKELNATAVELPYKGEGGRYSLLVLLPKAQDGLPKLTEALSKFSFRHLGKSMREKQVDVAIPAFQIDCVSHPQGVFRKMGMTQMMDKEGAEFPGISKTQHLYLQDNAMAQLVRFQVDDQSAVANYLSTMSMSTRSGLNVFHANHPFIFYLRDNLDNLTIVVGRVADPSIRPKPFVSEPSPEEETV